MFNKPYCSVSIREPCVFFIDFVLWYRTSTQTSIVKKYSVNKNLSVNFERLRLQIHHIPWNASAKEVREKNREMESNSQCRDKNFSNVHGIQNEYCAHIHKFKHQVHSTEYSIMEYEHFTLTQPRKRLLCTENHCCFRVIVMDVILPCILVIFAVHCWLLVVCYLYK